MEQARVAGIEATGTIVENGRAPVRSVLSNALCIAACLLAGCAAEPKAFRPAAMPDAPPASEPLLLERITPVAITGVLDGMGREYRVGYDNYGAPLIGVLPTGSEETQELFVLFNGCNDQNACEDITLVAWDLANGPIHLDMVNRWNRENRFSRAFMDPDYGPVLQTDINSTGGIGPDALAMRIERYFNDLQRFTSAADIV